MLNLAIMLETSARRYPDATAIIFEETRLSFRQVNAAANMVANGLRALGVGYGDRVALSLPNIPYFPICYFGILKTGATVVPLNVLFTSREVAYHLRDSDAKALIAFEMWSKEAGGGFLEAPDCEHLIIATSDPAARPPVEGSRTLGMLMYQQPPASETFQPNSDDTAVILYTSGTTGQPKGAELTHSNMVMNALGSRDLTGGGPGDVILVTLPLFHSFGQSVLMNAGLASGAALTLLPRFDATVALEMMQRDRVTIFAGVPTMYWGMLNVPHAESKFDLESIASHLRLCVSGGSALPVQVLRDFEEKFRVAILEGYGLSETSPAATFNHADRPRKAGSIGQPVWGVNVRIVRPDDPTHAPLPPGEIGEVVIQGHNVMKGYYNRPEATAASIQNGWFHTGDLGTSDEEGYFYIVDRLKEMILRGGFNVYPRELEEYLMTHPKVSLCAVKGISDPRMGEEIKAYIVLKEDEVATVDEIMQFAREGLAAYKCPRLIEFRDELPMTATGKILKRELVD